MPHEAWSTAMSSVARGMLGLAMALCLVGGTTEAAERPNILWISCEDIGPDLGCYGDEYATTPHLDQLASEGARFTRCFSHAGVCALSRSGLITGVSPVTLGSQHMRSEIVPPAAFKCFTEYLRGAGYWCTNRSKTDYNFPAPRTAWDENSARSGDWSGRAEGQPFFCVINLTTTHESQIFASYETLVHDPDKAEVPPYYPDTPTSRKDWARYHDQITKMDGQVGEILARLEADGLAESTIVLFWSDHGRGLPRAKRWIYDSGLHVPLIVRWPGAIEPETVREDLVVFVDFAPTMLSLAGVPLPTYLQGRVFLGEGTVEPPEFIFAHRDRMGETYDLIRGVRDTRFKYIRNYMPERTYAQNNDYSNQIPTLIEMRELHAAGKLEGTPELFFRRNKPVEELYDTLHDPHEVFDLSLLPEHQARLVQMRGALEEWQLRVGDQGMVPEPILMERMRKDVPKQTARPTGSVESGRVTLACETEGASIAYTTEAGEGAHWRLYTEPVALEEGRTLRAIACRLGIPESDPIEIRADGNAP